MSPRPAAALVVRKLIRASPAFLFAAWTEPQRLTLWWGPEGVHCPQAEVDLRVGGRYRIANRLPDGSTLWISGVFEVIEPPHRLDYTWLVEKPDAALERVSVQFESRGSATEVIVTHELIIDEPTRLSHERGWRGCLDGLQRLAEVR